eukprot:296788-Hanusia_phi.AAC.1
MEGKGGEGGRVGRGRGRGEEGTSTRTERAGEKELLVIDTDRIRGPELFEHLEVLQLHSWPANHRLLFSSSPPAPTQLLELLSHGLGRDWSLLLLAQPHRLLLRWV